MLLKLACVFVETFEMENLPRFNWQGLREFSGTLIEAVMTAGFLSYVY